MYYIKKDCTVQPLTIDIVIINGLEETFQCIPISMLESISFIHN